MNVLLSDFYFVGGAVIQLPVSVCCKVDESVHIELWSGSQLTVLHV